MALRLWANNKGQATLELAIFGSILIMLLGILVNYGLKYNFQQQVMMQTFRRALGLAADRRSATYILVKDHHIPNPSNPFGVGSIVPVSSSSSVTRDYRMQETADNASELPRIDIETPDGQVRRYKTAAFREEYNVPESDLSKYEEVYGPEGIGWWVIGDGESVGEMITEINPQTGEETQTPLNPTKNIRIIDNAAGEIMNYETVKMRYKKIKEAGINVPWYCDQIEALFAFSDISKPTMGLQQDYTQDTTINNTLNKQESTSGIRTQDTLDWQITTQRTIVYNDGLDSEGVSTGVVNVIGDEEGEGEVISNVSQDKTYEWQTAW